MNGAFDPQEKIKEEFITETIPVGWPWRLLIASLVLFLFSLFVYFGMRFGYNPNLEGRVSDLDRKFDALANQISLEDQNRFTTFYSQVINLKTVLEAHPFGANIFRFIETSVVNPVYFTGAELSMNDRKLSLQGVASTFDGLAQQIAVLEKSANAEKVFLKDVSVKEGVVIFTVEVVFREDFFKRPLP